MGIQRGSNSRRESNGDPRGGGNRNQEGKAIKWGSRGVENQVGTQDEEGIKWGSIFSGFLLKFFFK